MPKEILIKGIFYSLPAYLYKVRLEPSLVNLILDKNYLVCNFFLILSFLRSFLVRQLVDIVGIDTLNVQARFSIVYNILSIRKYFRLFIRCSTAETFGRNRDVTLESKIYGFYSLVNTNFKNYSWLEREVWDMFGIFFFNNLDLRRILTDYGFEGFPLRKDFPLTGFLELRYDDEVKSVIYEDLELTQEFRFFDFESPWKKKYFIK